MSLIHMLEADGGARHKSIKYFNNLWRHALRWLVSMTEACREIASTSTAVARKPQACRLGSKNRNNHKAITRPFSPELREASLLQWSSDAMPYAGPYQQYHPHHALNRDVDEALHVPNRR